MENVKEINIKNRTYYSFDDIINSKDFDSSLLKINKKSCKNIDIYYIGYITMKDFDYVKINNVNPLYLIIGEVDEFIEEKNGNKYLTLVSTDKSKEVLIKYTKRWDKIKNLIECNPVKHSSSEKINGSKSGEYEKHFMKIKFNSDGNLTLNKILKIHNMTKVVRFVFEEDGKYYPQVFLDECLCEL